MNYRSRVVVSIIASVVVIVTMTIVSGCANRVYSTADMNDSRVISRCEDSRYYMDASGLLYNDSDSNITVIHYYRDSTNPLLRNSEVYSVDPRKRYKVVIWDRDDIFQINTCDGKVYNLNVRKLGITSNYSKEEKKVLGKFQKPKGYKR